MKLQPNSFPFRLNEEFKLAIGSTQNHFVVACNGNLLFAYPTESDAGSSDRFEIICKDGLKVRVSGMSYNKIENLMKSFDVKTKTDE